MVVLKVRKATLDDLQVLRKFTDFWLAGRGLRVNAPGAVDDCFISPSQHRKYITKYQTWILGTGAEIVGWAVVQHDGSLIHFLIAGSHRGRGIGTTFLEEISPETIHSKSNQSSGDPGKFYESRGYVKTGSVKSKSRLDIDKIRPNRKPIIDIYQKVS